MNAKKQNLTKQSDFLTAKDCAKYLGFSESYFYKLRKNHPIPYHSFGDGDRKYYIGKEVDDYLHTIGRNHDEIMLQ